MKIVEILKMFTLAVNDVDEAKAFYTETLGFKLIGDSAQDSKRWVTVEFPAGGTSIILSNVHENLKPGAMKFYIVSSDVEAAYEELISKGVKPTQEGDDWGRWDNPDGKGQKWFELKDPDGNRLMIIPS